MKSWVLVALAVGTAGSLAALAATPVAAQVRMLNSTPQLEDPLAGPVVDDPLVEMPGVRLSLMQGAAQKQGDATFQPEIGQAGKDVIWVPTPDSLVKAMLTVADVEPDDYVVDLGSGDGRIAIAAAKDFGARAQGIEYNPDMVALARRNAQKAGVASKVTFRQADIFETDFSDATVVTMYLLPSLNLKLRDTILKMRPGTRVVSNAFTMGDWEPERTITTDDATGYYWVVPANVAGRWAFEVGTDRFAAELGQQYQKLVIARGGPLTDGQVNGTAISLTRAGGRVLEGVIRGDQMQGGGWVATRIKPAG
jgi:SAM-dependent methyltransferase